MQAALAIDQVEQPAVVDGHVVALNAVGAFRYVRHEMPDFTRGARIADVDETEAGSKPGDGNFRAGQLFAGLMAGREGRVRPILKTGDPKTCERHRPRFVGDIDEPQASRRRSIGSVDVLIGDNHDTSTVDFERQRDSRMGWATEGRAPVEP